MSDELFEKYYAGTLEEDDAARLKALLAGDAAARRAFRCFTVERLILVRMSGAGAKRVMTRRVTARSRPRPRGPEPRWFFPAAAAAVAVLVAAAAIGLGRPDARSAVRSTAATGIDPVERVPVPIVKRRPLDPPAVPSRPDPGPPIGESPKSVAAPVRGEAGLPPDPVPEPMRELPKSTVAAKVEPPPGITLERTAGDVRAVVAGTREIAEPGRAYAWGAGFETAGAGSLAVLAFKDGTRVEIGPDSSVREIPEGKRVPLARGRLVARVAKQPAAAPMVFVTPHAEVRVLGTTLGVTAGAEATRVEVDEGRVRMTRRLDGKSVELAAGQAAVAAPGVEFSARTVSRRVLEEDFSDPRAAFASWRAVDGGFPVLASEGRIVIDLSPRPRGEYASGWHVPGGLYTRALFRLPVRVSLDYEISSSHPGLLAGISLRPLEAKSSRAFLVHLRDQRLYAGADVFEKVPAAGPGAFALKGRCTLEVSAEREMRVLLGAAEIWRRPLGPEAPDLFEVGVVAAARPDAPPGSRVAFDNVRIEPPGVERLR